MLEEDFCKLSNELVELVMPNKGGSIVRVIEEFMRPGALRPEPGIMPAGWKEKANRLKVALEAARILHVIYKSA